MRKPALLAAVLLGLIGACWAGLNSWSQPAIGLPPVTSGEVFGGGFDRLALTAEQLTAISHWFAAHRAGWRTVVETAPAPLAAIELHHPGGQMTSMDVYRSPPSPPGWNGAVVLRQRATGELLHSGEQKFSAQDLKEFLRLIGR